MEGKWYSQSGPVLSQTMVRAFKKAPFLDVKKVPFESVFFDGREKFNFSHHDEIALHVFTEHSFLKRCFCGPSRSFRFFFNEVFGDGGDIIFNVQRPELPMCCGDDHASVMVGQKEFAKIIIPFYVISPTIKIQDNVNGEDSHRMYHSSFFPCPCMSSRAFELTDTNGEIVGGVERKPLGGGYQISLPDGSTPVQRATISAAALLINTRYFENRWLDCCGDRLCCGCTLCCGVCR